LNFTFIVNEDISNFADFKKFTEPIIEMLRKLSVNAEFSGRKRYNDRRQENFGKCTVEVHMNVERGFIEDVKFYWDFFGKRDIAEVEGLLKGVKHEEDEIKKSLSKKYSRLFCGN
jgi:hypothetical protein